MLNYHHSARVSGLFFAAVMSENGETCAEHVDVSLPRGSKRIHEATFNASNLGDADRKTYIKSMLASVAYAFIRDMRGMSKKDLLNEYQLAIAPELPKTPER